MDVEEIRRAVLATIASIAPGTDVNGIRAGEPLRPQVDLDSMDWLNVILALHERLRVDIPERDYGRLATLDSLVAYLDSRLAHPPREPPPAQAPAGPRITRHVVHGVPVTIRPMRARDLPLEADFIRHLSGEARYERFMLTFSELSEEKLRYLTAVDQVGHVALVAAADREGQPSLVGVVRYIVDPSGQGCEFAIAIDDAWHGSGVAGILMHALIDIARERGLARMEGIVLATNARMLRFTRQLGFRHERDPEDRETVRVVLALRGEPGATSADVLGR